MSVKSLVVLGLLPALLFAHPVMGQSSASIPTAQAMPKDGPCFHCTDPEGQRLQDAWNADATTAHQREVMGQIIAIYTTQGRTAWATAMQQYFAWRSTGADTYSPSATPTTPDPQQSTRQKPSRKVDPNNIWASVTDEYGPAPSDVLPAIRMAAMGYLKDPDSGQYQIQNLFKGYCRNGWLNGNKVAWKGWAVNVMINGKNAYGGYVGYSPATVLLDGNGGRILEGFNFGAYGPRKGLLGGGAGVCQIVP